MRRRGEGEKEAGRMFKGFVVAFEGEFTTGRHASHNSGALKCLCVEIPVLTCLD